MIFILRSLICDTQAMYSRVSMVNADGLAPSLYQAIYYYRDVRLWIYAVP